MKWETTASKNIGLDFSLFNDRFGLTVDVYENKTKDLLLNVPIASTFGYATQLQNIGATRNKGFEIQLNAGIIKNKNFSWNANFNLSSNNNVVALGYWRRTKTLCQVILAGVLQASYYDYVVEVGEPIGCNVWVWKQMVFIK